MHVDLFEWYIDLVVTFGPGGTLRIGRKGGVLFYVTLLYIDCDSDWEGWSRRCEVMGGSAW